MENSSEMVSILKTLRKQLKSRYSIEASNGIIANFITETGNHSVKSYLDFTQI